MEKYKVTQHNQSNHSQHKIETEDKIEDIQSLV